MRCLDPMPDELEFEAVGGGKADELSAALDGKSPYNGTLPFAVELHLHQSVIDDDFVVTINKPGGDKVVQVFNPIGFHRERAICEASSAILGTDAYEELVDLTPALAERGYRLIITPTGVFRGLSDKLLFMADPISELDAALQLDAEPDYIYDLLDGGADPMRHHVKFGKPFHVAMKKASASRPEYSEVVAYMRAFGAH